MRLISWNSLRGLDAPRARALSALRPDVAVVPECTRELVWPWIAGPAPTSRLWRGDRDDKGLGVVSFEGSLVAESAPPLVPWVIDVAVSGPADLHLVAIWTVQKEGWPAYTIQVAEAIEAYADRFSAGRTILIGDLNCSAQTAQPKWHLKNVERLRELGMVSAYHAHHGIEAGQEKQGTLYWTWNRAKPYHCDLAFLPVGWVPRLRSATVGDFDDWVTPRLSDHVPLVLDLDVPPA